MDIRGSVRAAVHCVIVGFCRDAAEPRLFDYPTLTSPLRNKQASRISRRTSRTVQRLSSCRVRPLNPQLGDVVYGNKPTDGGWLIVGPEDYDQVCSDPIATQFVRKYIGARELLHNRDRYCLWLTDMKPSQAKQSPVLRERLEVSEHSEPTAGSVTREAAATPHLFRQIAQPLSPYLCIPRHVSETRPYFLAARFPPEVITSQGFVKVGVTAYCCGRA